MELVESVIVLIDIFFAEYQLLFWLIIFVLFLKMWTIKLQTLKKLSTKISVKQDKTPLVPNEKLDGEKEILTV